MSAANAHYFSRTELGDKCCSATVVVTVAAAEKLSVIFPIQLAVLPPSLFFSFDLLLPILTTASLR